jgi:hypothetical protein
MGRGGVEGHNSHCATNSLQWITDIQVSNKYLVFMKRNELIFAKPTIKRYPKPTIKRYPKPDDSSPKSYLYLFSIILITVRKYISSLSTGFCIILFLLHVSAFLESHHQAIK